MGRLADHVSAINEFRDTLGEESVSKLRRDDQTVEFRVQAPGNPAFALTVDADYPRCAGLLVCTSDDSLDLSAINAKLEDACSVGKVLCLLGRQLGVDLDWTAEAVEGDAVLGSGDEDEPMESEDEDAMSDDGGGIDDDVIREWSRKLVAVEAIEAAAVAAERAAAEAAEADDGPLPAAADAEKQIFDPKAAFRRLVNELEEIFKAQDFNLMADAPGPAGLFHWEVSLAGFDPGSPLAADLQQAGRRFGISSVQLTLDFKRGLHPFYPPSLRVVAPRFQGPVHSAVSCFPEFKPDAWDPTISAKEMILKVKAFLEAGARVDLDTGAQNYHPVESLEARLQALSGVQPADPSTAPDVVYAELYRRLEGSDADTALPSPSGPASKKARAGAATEAQDADEEAAEGSSKARPALAWGKGVGYGHGRGGGSGAVWDARRAEALQKARDTEACDVLERLAEAASAALEPQSDAEDRSRVCTALRTGCVVPLLIKELAAAGFQDMAARASYYRALLRCVAVVAAAEPAMLTWHGPRETKTLATAVASLRAQAATFMHVMGAQTGGSQGVGTPTGTPSGRRSERSASRSGAANDDADSALASFLLEVADEVAKKAEGGPRTRRASAAAAATPAGAPNDAEARYAAALSPYRVSMVPGVATAHVFRDSAAKEPTAPSRARARRVASELASMESDLPVTSSSSVFVVADERQTVLWKAIITGPRDTPYAGGCFLFDIYFPHDYPARPPQVKIRTTGGGSVRFNPNLYNCGKVCLSLLGTWQGERGETWNSDYSSILQVLVSIQSLIFCENPYYNEPGYEARPDDGKSNAYNADVMENTVRWAMLDQLRSAPEYFKEAVQAHFREQGEEVLETVRRWKEKCTETGHTRHAAAIAGMLPDLEAEIAKLR